LFGWTCRWFPRSILKHQSFSLLCLLQSWVPCVSSPSCDHFAIWCLLPSLE
jgi:hypothetical protein